MFATVMSLVLPMCILISCSNVLCVLMVLGMLMFVKVMSSMISLMSPSSLFVLSVCGYGGVVFFLCLSFCVSFLYCDDDKVGCCARVFFLVSRFCC